MSTYPTPVDKLLTYGKPEPVEAPDWPNYLDLGISPEHIPDLIRMLTDEELLNAEIEDPKSSAPIHAWRTLGQLHDMQALEPLLNASHVLETHPNDYGEWVIEELPEVYALLGPQTIPELEAHMADTSKDEHARGTAITGLQKIATQYPETREQCIEILTRQLAKHTKGEYELNAFIVGALADLKATEAAPVIEKALEADVVDTSISGDWDAVQVDLGLKEAPERDEEPLTLEKLLSGIKRPAEQPTASPAASPAPVAPPRKSSSDVIWGSGKRGSSNQPKKAKGKAKASHKKNSKKK